MNREGPPVGLLFFYILSKKIGEIKKKNEKSMQGLNKAGIYKVMFLKKEFDL